MTQTPELKSESSTHQSKTNILTDMAGTFDPEVAQQNILDAQKVETEQQPNTLPSPEKKEQHLTFEKMAHLSTDEYLETWRQLNPFYMTHVTRQGVRDHNAMFYHSSGMGELHDGFKNILKDGKVLRTPAEVEFDLPKNFDEKDVQKMLEKQVFSNPDYEGMSPQTILNNLPLNKTLATADPWADKRAIHLAQHTVLNDIYGAEDNNEAFFVFPTDLIASQSQFGGHMHNNLTTASVKSDRKWNDLFVWSKDGQLPIDAGIAFLPKSQMVDPATGSKYATEKIIDENGQEQRVTVKDEEKIQRFKDWLLSLNDNSPELTEALDGNDEKLQQKLTEIGVPEQCLDAYALQDFVQNKAFKENVWILDPEEKEKMTPAELTDYSVRTFLSWNQADLKLAEGAIPAQEYWENYFAKHPEQRPAHLVYYDGNPSAATRNFLENQGIINENPSAAYQSDTEKLMTGPGDSSERDGDMLGFDQNCIGDGSNDPQLKAEHQRFNEIALRLLQEHQQR